jgi:hypothetical protein
VTKYRRYLCLKSLSPAKSPIILTRSRAAYVNYITTWIRISYRIYSLWRLQPWQITDTANTWELIDSWVPPASSFFDWPRPLIGTDCLTNCLTNKTNSVALSPRANYTDWATAICRRNLMPNSVDRGVSHGQRGGSRTVVNLSFIDRSCYFSFK